jgi:branched-chain amino acid transport system ATP-binding protein
MSILSLQNVTQAFGGIIALNDVTFQVEEGEILGLIGPNGSGKSTAINVITGFYLPRQGQVRFQGREITNWKPHRIARLGLTRTFQLTQLLARATVLDNVLTGMYMHCGENLWDAVSHSQEGNPKERKLRTRAREIMEFVGIADDAGKPCMAASHFTRKRLGLAMAFATRPKIMLIDELVSGLSEEESRGMMKVVRDIRATGVTVLMVEHNMRVIMSLCERIVVLKYGTKIAEGTPDQVAANKEVQEAYLGAK